MSLAPVLIALIMSALIGGAIVIVFLSWRSSKQKPDNNLGRSVLQGIANNHDGRYDGQRVTLEHRRHQVSVRHVVSKHSHFTVSLTPPGEGYPRAFAPLDEETWGRPIQLVHQPTIQLTREVAANRFGKAMKLNREVQTGDVDFDKAIYVHTNAAHEVVHQILRRAATRKAIMGLLDAGYASVNLFNSDAPVSVTHQKPVAGAFHKASFEAQLDWLSTIAEGLPCVEVERPSAQVWTRALTMSLSAGLLSLAGFILCLATIDTWPTLGGAARHDGALLGLGLWLLAQPLMVLTMRGFSNSFSAFFVASCCLIIGLPATAVAVCSGLNALADDSPALRVEARVVDRRTTSSKNSTTYHISLDPGSHGAQTDLTVDYGLYYKTSIGARVTLVTHEGALGWRWIDKIIP